MKWSESHSVVSDSLRPRELYSSWNSPGQNTGVGSLCILQRIFPTQGLNPGLPHCRQILYQLSHQGSPRILEWVAYPFSSGSSQPRNWTRVSCTAGRFFTNWTIRSAWQIGEDAHIRKYRYQVIYFLFCLSWWSNSITNTYSHKYWVVADSKVLESTEGTIYRKCWLIGDEIFHKYLLLQHVCVRGRMRGTRLNLFIFSIK